MFKVKDKEFLLFKIVINSHTPDNLLLILHRLNGVTLPKLNHQHTEVNSQLTANLKTNLAMLKHNPVMLMELIQLKIQDMLSLTKLLMVILSNNNKDQVVLIQLQEDIKVSNHSIHIQLKGEY